MKLNSEQKAQVYKLLGENEATKSLVELLKEDLVNAGRMTNENEELKTQLKNFEGLNIADLKSKAEFVDSKGGVDSIIGTYSKAEGYDSDIERVKKEKDEYKAKNEELVKKAEGSNNELETLRLRNLVGDTFTKTFKSSLVLDDCMSKGRVYKSEDGSPWVKTADGAKPLDGDGMTYLKGLPEYSGLLNVPDGTNDGLKAPNSDNKKPNNFRW